MYDLTISTEEFIVRRNDGRLIHHLILDKDLRTRIHKAYTNNSSITISDLDVSFLNNCMYSILYEVKLCPENIEVIKSFV